jgi:hypothetical protein
LLVLRHWQLAASSSEIAAVPPDWLSYSLLISVWLAVLSTVYSGLEYIVAAIRILSRQGA